MRSKGRTFNSLIIHLSYLCAIVTVSLTSCSSRVDVSDQLAGKWSVSDAYRNEKLTTTLEDGYFHFLSDSVFVTNIFSLDQQFNYYITEDGFEQKGDIEVNYIIEQLIEDTLVLTTQINAYDFRFVAVRDSTEMGQSIQ